MEEVGSCRHTCHTSKEILCWKAISAKCQWYQDSISIISWISDTSKLISLSHLAFWGSYISFVVLDEEKRSGEECWGEYISRSALASIRHVCLAMCQAAFTGSSRFHPHQQDEAKKLHVTHFIPTHIPSKTKPLSHNKYQDGRLVFPLGRRDCSFWPPSLVTAGCQNFLRHRGEHNWQFVADFQTVASKFYISKAARSRKPVTLRAMPASSRFPPWRCVLLKWFDHRAVHRLLLPTVWFGSEATRCPLCTLRYEVFG